MQAVEEEHYLANRWGFRLIPQIWKLVKVLRRGGMSKGKDGVVRGKEKRNEEKGPLPPGGRTPHAREAFDPVNIITESASVRETERCEEEGTLEGGR
ncbi:hypothetical protein EYF80_055712 [Liparis tanakae]|uniref:Uncharacterized protein n=1 Tax=Liparis tanakae TaxID=230148 RepID=A0A4Z2EZ35_9TELE|nr:hypothetical protein EYF80_055712 [Liparis tanakae]